MAIKFIIMVTIKLINLLQSQHLEGNSQFATPAMTSLLYLCVSYVQIL